MNIREHLPDGFPKIVCLCGSTRFKESWYEHTKRLTHEGIIVLGVGDLDCSDAARNVNVSIAPELKVMLDELHKRKIDLADEIAVICPPCRVCPKCKTVWRHDHIRVEKCSCHTVISDVPPAPYIGASTRSEIEYAAKLGKPIRYLES